MKRSSLAALVIIVLAIILLSGSLYEVRMWDQVVLTYFGKPVNVVTDPGLHLKIPFFYKVTRFDRRVLEWDGSADQIPTKDKRYIWVDTFARWRIVDPLKFFQSMRTENAAQSRLDDIIDGATRDFVTENYLLEVVRNSNRELVVEEEGLSLESEVQQISQGRVAITKQIFAKAAPTIKQFGIELLDVQIKRVNYVEDVRLKVFERMVSERRRVAGLYRAEGQKAAQEIEGQREKELRSIESQAYKESQEIRGEGDAESTKIYADAYNLDPEFYTFSRTLETFRENLESGTTLMFTTDSDYFKYLKRAGNPR